MCLLVQLVPPNITNIHHHQSDSLKNMLDDMTSHAWASVMLCKCAEATGLFAHSLVARQSVSYDEQMLAFTGECYIQLQLHLCTSKCTRLWDNGPEHLPC